MYADLLSLYLLPFCAQLFFEDIIEKKFKKLIRFSMLLHLAFFIGTILLDITGVVPIINTLLAFEFLLIFSCLLTAIISVISSIHGNIQTKIFTIGIVGLAVFGAYDALVDLRIISWTRHMAHWGIFILILSMVVIMMRNYYEIISHLIASEKELDVAQIVQSAILTGIIDYQNLDNLLIDIQYIPMNKKVSGDYYNIAKMNNGEISLFIADASGHGIQAALSTMQIDILNKESFDLKYPHERLEYINMMLENIGSRNFFTGFLLNFFPEKIFYSSAGHPTQYLIKKDGKEIIELKTGGKPIGIFENIKYETSTKHIEDGDVIILFTDGIYEVFNPQGEELGDIRFLNLLKEFANQGITDKTPNEIGNTILKEIYNFTGAKEQNDDITLIIIKIVKITGTKPAD